MNHTLSFLEPTEIDGLEYLMGELPLSMIGVKVSFTKRLPGTVGQGYDVCLFLEADWRGFGHAPHLIALSPCNSSFSDVSSLPSLLIC